MSSSLSPWNSVCVLYYVENLRNVYTNLNKSGGIKDKVEFSSKELYKDNIIVLVIEETIEHLNCM